MGRNGLEICVRNLTFCNITLRIFVYYWITGLLQTKITCFIFEVQSIYSCVHCCDVHCYFSRQVARLLLLLLLLLLLWKRHLTKLKVVRTDRSVAVHHRWCRHWKLVETVSWLESMTIEKDWRSTSLWASLALQASASVSQKYSATDKTAASSSSLCALVEWQPRYAGCSLEHFWAMLKLGIVELCDYVHT